jgi:hypothetical protein
MSPSAQARYDKARRQAKAKGPIMAPSVAGSGAGTKMWWHRCGPKGRVIAYLTLESPTCLRCGLTLGQVLEAGGSHPENF